MVIPSFGEISNDKKRVGAYISIPRNNSTKMVLVQAPTGGGKKVATTRRFISKC